MFPIFPLSYILSSSTFPSLCTCNIMMVHSCAMVDFLRVCDSIAVGRKLAFLAWFMVWLLN